MEDRKQEEEREKEEGGMWSENNSFGGKWATSYAAFCCTPLARPEHPKPVLRPDVNVSRAESTTRN